MSSDLPFSTVMQTEIVALSRTSLANGLNDATQCYEHRVLVLHMAYHPLQLHVLARLLQMHTITVLMFFR